ncbi:GTPase HflX [Anaerococcus degeneri]|uniref:GTPase HflX n=1 Tax=Anaerococcus degeneri TaxID=361500 RepID=A0ABS7Z3A7_9FIRM|nr:GTPase HflX [Anaerococcus degeneri]MBP2014812.1 GTP-binding protein HflX [Anaerococcus degeneri]MCA2097021.1 GTPase HflX [Anaerococcus degeneri]
MQEVIQVNVLGKDDDEEIKIYELESLINTAGGKSVAFVSQVVTKVNPRFYIGKGKLEEIRDLANKLEVKTIIFDVELSASQLYNLEEELKLKVVDWTSLILDIFAQRAHTKEARLKIKLAQLKYQLPRINKWFAYLSRQAGGIGTRGPGETMLETDRRAIERDIRSLEKALKDVEKTKRLNRKSRDGTYNISLVGYTNAGKSTILNGMMKLFGLEKYVYSDDLLFATLDTSTRRLDFSNTKVTLTDTVGFIDNLSKELNDSFLTTLEEIKFADMLLIVIDSSNNIEGQISTIDKSLSEIEMDDKEIIYVFNKMDRVKDDTAVSLYKRDYERIFISAKDDNDLESLKEEIVKVIKEDYKQVRMHIPFSKGSVLDYFMTNYDILKTDYDNEGTIIDLEISKGDYGKYESYINK